VGIFGKNFIWLAGIGLEKFKNRSFFPFLSIHIKGVLKLKLRKEFSLR
jgi:hypothetical protein